MLGVSQLDGLTADEEQVLKIDTNRLQIENVRPIETGLGSSVGDLSGFQVRVLADPESVFDRCSDGDEIACDELWLEAPKVLSTNPSGLRVLGRSSFETRAAAAKCSQSQLGVGRLQVGRPLRKPSEGTALTRYLPRYADERVTCSNESSEKHFGKTASRSS